MASLSSAKSSIKDVLLSDQSTWDAWYETIKAAVPDPVWQYFDPDSEVVFSEPIKPTAPQPEAPPESPPQSSGPSTRSTQTVAAETAEQQAAREARFDKALTMYATRLNIYRIEKKDWDDYHTRHQASRDYTGVGSEPKGQETMNRTPGQSLAERSQSIDCTGRRGHTALHPSGVYKLHTSRTYQMAT
ncbi:hypothetical protein MMC22_005706 [Lobaria immixta]|nr:hypothetical protein [Lobaria immixta]